MALCPRDLTLQVGSPRYQSIVPQLMWRDSRESKDSHDSRESDDSHDSRESSSDSRESDDSRESEIQAIRANRPDAL